MNTKSLSTPPLPVRKPEYVRGYTNQPAPRRSQSMMECTRYRSFKPKPQKAPARAPAYEPKPPEDFPVKLTLNLEPEEKDTDLARLCSDALTELPLLVQVKEAFRVDGNDLRLEKGEQLMLHFIGELPRVHAVDSSDGSEMWLPVNAEQEYERLPLDPRLDDKMFMGVTALMQSKPMPSVVRAVEGYGSDDSSECVDMEDVIVISHVEYQIRRDVKQKVLIASNQVGHRLALHKDMDCAYFTTMMSALFLHMSQLVDFAFPQRVRVVEEKSIEHRTPKTEKILKLLSYKNDLQVIATRANAPGLLSIPLTVPLKLTTVTFKEKNLKKCLPPLFLPLNLTWGFHEVGRSELPLKMTGITQPLPEVVHAWLDSYEGKERSCKAANISKADMERDMKEMNYYNKDLSDRLSALNSTSKPSVPLRAHSTLPPPPRPPKPTTPKPTTATKPTMSPAKMKPGIVKRKSAPPVEGIKPVTKFKLPERRDNIGDGYEVPKTLNESDEEIDDDYEEVSDINQPKGSAKDIDNNTSSELKRILQQKEKVIGNLKEQNSNLIDTCKNLEEEKDKLRQTSTKHMEEINRLQCEIDRLLSIADLDIYDTISPSERPLPTLPKTDNSTIYSTPDSLMVERACLARTDTEGVADVLRSLNLSRYIDKFKLEEVDGPLLISLQDAELKEDLGMSGLHARKLLLEVKKRVK